MVSLWREVILLRRLVVPDVCKGLLALLLAWDHVSARTSTLLGGAYLPEVEIGGLLVVRSVGCRILEGKLQLLVVASQVLLREHRLTHGLLRVLVKLKTTCSMRGLVLVTNLLLKLELKSVDLFLQWIN